MTCECVASRRFATRVIAEIAVASVGTALLLCAVLANQRWLDRHFLPSWFLPRQWYVLIESSVRVDDGRGRRVARALRCGHGSGASSRQRRRASSSRPSRRVLALGASELVLRRVHLRAAEWLVPDEEPRRRRDPRLGWTFVPARTGHNTVGGRVIDYAFDPAGYRVRRVDEPVDPERPTILFVGESVMFGEGLTWEESVPAQVGAMMGIQSANLAVHGFGSDQAYLQARDGAAPFSAAGGGGLAVHDGALRPEPGRRSAASRAGACLAAGGTARAAGVARQAARALPDRRTPSSAASR